MAATRRKNQGATWPRCLCCARSAHIQETECAERVFCGTRCQAHLHGVQQFFNLGMKRKAGAIGKKRGAGALKKEAPQIFVWPDILPDDVLCLLLRWAYGDELRSVREFDELWAMRRLGKENGGGGGGSGAARQFKRVIDECVVPLIHTLSDDILRKIYVHTLRRFAGLREITLFTGGGKRPDEDARGRLTLAEYEGDVFDSLSRVTALTIAEYARPTLAQLARVLPQLTFFSIHTPSYVPKIPYGEMASLREHVLLRGGAVDLIQAPALERLIIQMSREEGVAPPFPSLRQLALDRYHSIDGVAEACPALEVLRLGFAMGTFGMNAGQAANHRALDAMSVAAMTTLRALDIRSSSITFDDGLLVSLPELRSLLVRGNGVSGTTFSDEALALLVHLESLALENKFPPGLSGASVATLINLTWLSLSGCPFAVDFTALVHLRVLDLTRRGGALVDAIAHLRDLHTLILRYNRSVSHQQVRELGPQLHILSLSGKMDVDDAALGTCVALRVLELGQSGHGISSVGLSALVSLHTLYLGDQPERFEFELAWIPNLTAIHFFGTVALSNFGSQVLRARGVTIWIARNVIMKYPLPAIWTQGASPAFLAEWDHDPYL